MIAVIVMATNFLLRHLSGNDRSSLDNICGHSLPFQNLWFRTITCGIRFTRRLQLFSRCRWWFYFIVLQCIFQIYTKQKRSPNINISITINRSKRIRNYLRSFTNNCDIGLFSSELPWLSLLARLIETESRMIEWRFMRNSVLIHR